MASTDTYCICCYHQKKQRFMIYSFIKKEVNVIVAMVFAVCLLAARIWQMGGPCLNDYRMVYCDSFKFIFLLWNLFLAWVPLLIVQLLQYWQTGKTLSLVGIALWLLFFPNAPYLITDFVHLRPQADIPIWYDVLLLFMYAYLGLVFAMRSLHLLKPFLVARFGLLFSRLFIGFSLLLSGLGIYLGRVERWNSWDLFTQPLALGNSIFNLLSQPLDQAQAMLMIIGFSAFLSVAYFLYPASKQV